jgi:hypothetical protein
MAFGQDIVIVDLFLGEGEQDLVAGFACNYPACGFAVGDALGAFVLGLVYVHWWSLKNFSLLCCNM